MDIPPIDNHVLPSPPNAARPISPKSKGHFTGHLIVGNGGGQVMEVESHLEMTISLVLSVKPDVAELENQVPFRWRCAKTGEHKTHFFDFRVNKMDGSRTAIIAKRSKKLACEDFLAESREIARQVTPDFADQVTIMTERDIDPIEVHNAAFLHGLREADPEADSAARRFLARTVGAVSVRDVVTAVDLDGRGFRAVGRLLRNKEIELLKKERISMDALVMRRIA
jgi:hypothetical protein